MLQVGTRSRDEMAACASSIQHALTCPCEIETAMTRVGGRAVDWHSAKTPPPLSTSVKQPTLHPIATRK